MSVDAGGGISTTAGDVQLAESSPAVADPLLAANTGANSASVEMKHLNTDTKSTSADSGNKAEAVPHQQRVMMREACQRALSALSEGRDLDALKLLQELVEQQALVTDT